MRQGFDHNHGIPLAMFFPNNYHRLELPEKAKGLERCTDQRKMIKVCPTTLGRSGCDPSRDFQEQKSLLEEQILARNHEVIFYPKFHLFHCELNFVERYWCAAKYYVQEHCEYSLDGLRTVLPTALNSVSTVSINRYYNHCVRVIEAYSKGVDYDTKEFTARV
ncbi:hypothetical protein FN846DRAFT_929145 [Sphaerosporella brunnea]|uniref:Uncharacterized protein n=1 Tax=Sphaerosporella brunnea TaxID=1250544 RepID=A0A5J5FA27_9PEZI|nr:hypothetical protein FN846DRAFT_929145 [Sphaerosporella brunnea]